QTIKVRLQNQRKNVASVPGVAGVTHYRGIAHAAITIPKQEGISAMFKGLESGLVRQTAFATLRLGLYNPIRDWYVSVLSASADGTSTPTLGIRALAAATTGAIAITVASPADLVKVRMQGAAPGVYKNTLDCFLKSLREGGVAKLWTGLGPNIARNSVMNMMEVATYDQLKSYLVNERGWEAGTQTFIACGLGAGAVSTVVGSPLDVIKVRIMSKQVDAKGQPLYRNAVDCFMKILRQEGVSAFYKGLSANYLRVGSFNTVIFLTYESVLRM
ncbi:hypothetical protein SARC_11255, partial [Sphaeroforma arctica JP610]